MIDDWPLLRFAEFGALTDQERNAVIAMCEPPRVYDRHRTIRREGEQAFGFFVLVDGWATASVSLPDGGRQILKIHLPGDALGTPSMSVSLTPETLTAITPVTVCMVPFERFGTLLHEHPRVAAFFMLSIQRERVALMDQLASMGRTSAESRLAALLLDLMERLEPLGVIRDDSFQLLLTQQQIGDVLGLTSVHVNRTMRELEQRAVIARDRQQVQVLDRPALARIAARPQRKLRTDLNWIPPAR